MKKTEPKKTPWGIIIAVITAVFILVVTFVLVKIITDAAPAPEEIVKFSLDSEFYNTDGSVIGTNPEELQKVINDKKSFVIYSSTPACTEQTAQFREYVTEFQTDKKISFYYMTSDKMKETSIYDTVKYYPSVILFKDGELKQYLDMNSDADLPFYQSTAGFTEWFEKYVNLEP